MKKHLLAGTLLIAPAALAEELVICELTPSNIPDGSSSGLVISLDVPAVPNGRTVVAARIDLDIEHPWTGDLVVRLGAPDGTSVDLLDRAGMVPYGFPGPFGCGGDDVLALFEDSAGEWVEDACAIGPQPVFSGSLRPAEPLGVLVGVEPTGTWTLEVRDAQSGDSGQFMSACLRLEVAEDCDRDGVPDDCSCIADLNGDLIVDGSDLAALLGNWGSSNAAADLDLDGIVGGSDLSILLGNWGGCS